MASTGATSAPASSSSSSAATHSNVYVKNLADEIDDEILRSVFAQHGEIRSACVMVDQITKKSRNFGFVKFDDVKAAENAIRALNEQEVAGRKLVVKLADADTDDKPKSEPQPSDNLYVKGLPLTMLPEQLHQMFSVYGNVAQLKILTRQGQGSTGEALVRMADVEQAKWAMQNLHMSTVADSNQPILVRFADSPEEKSRRKTTAPRKPASRFPPAGGAGGGYGGPHSMPPEGFVPLMHPMNDPWGGGALPQPNFGMPPDVHAPTGGGQMAPMPVQGGGLCNLYVNDLPLDADDLFLYRTFAPLGAITSVRVMRDEHGHSRGFGFVKFVHPQDAMGAISTVNGKLIKGKAVHVSHKTASKHPQPTNQTPPPPPGRVSRQGLPSPQQQMPPGMQQGMQGGMQGMPVMSQGMPQQQLPPHMMHPMPQHHLQQQMHHQ